MKTSFDNQRQKNNIAGANHNDRTMEDTTRKKRDHIDWTRSHENKIMVRVEGWNFPVKQGQGELAMHELGYYRDTFSPSVEAQKEKYLAKRQKKRAEECTIERLYQSDKTGVQKTLLQVGKEGEYEDKAKFEKMCFELADYFETQKGEDFRHTVLSLSFHYDETSLHCHLNHVYEVKDKDGNWKPAKDDFLKKMNIELPDKTKEKSRKNNRAQVLVAQDREKWQNIVEEIDKEVSLDRVPEKKKEKQKIDHEKGKAIQSANKAIERANTAAAVASEYEAKAEEAKKAYEDLVINQEEEYREFLEYKENKALLKKEIQDDERTLSKQKKAIERNREKIDYYYESMSSRGSAVQSLRKLKDEDFLWQMIMHIIEKAPQFLKGLTRVIEGYLKDCNLWKDFSKTQLELANKYDQLERIEKEVTADLAPLSSGFDNLDIDDDLEL